MSFVNSIFLQIETVPEYWLPLKAGLAILAMGLPIYIGLRYFLYRRRLKAPLSLTFGIIGVFALYAGLAFILASPLADHMAGAVLTTYLFVTCLISAQTIVSLIDLFFIQHYLTNIKKVYISPPLRMGIKVCIFCLSILLILRYVLHFNPLTLIAIPTIVTAGIAFALQDTLKAFVAGIGLGHLVRLGEWIAFQDKEGRVIDVNWARTVIETPDGQRVYIPNSLLQSGIFLNYTSGNPTNRQTFKISASYDAEPAHVKETLLKCAHLIPGISAVPPPQAYLTDYAESGIVYGLYYWVDNYTRRIQIQDDVATRVWYAFKREGISIPYPTRNVLVRRNAEGAKISSSGIAKSLQRWSLAEAFYSEELQELSQRTQACRYAPGEVIVNQGDSGESVFVITEGTVEVFAAPALDRSLATLGPGEIFGEMSLLTGEPRSATVRAKTPLTVLVIEKSALQKIMTKRPELSERLAEQMVKRRAVLATAAASQTKPSSSGAEDHATLAKRIRQFFGLA